jgi:glycosyltransferase involved in cell wall biosynthesis
MLLQPRSSAHRHPYRVAEVSTSLDRGGKERVIVELARRCDRDKLEVEVVSLGDRGVLGEELHAAGFTVHALNRPSGFSPSLICRLARLFRRNRIDVVHTHDDRAAVHGLPAAWMAGIKRRIHTQHHSQILYGGRSKIHLAARAGRLANTFVCVSRFGADLMRGEGIPAAALKVLPNGIDVKRFSFSGPDLHGPAMTVARLSPEKDLTSLLHAVARLTEEAPDFRLEIVGDGPSRAELSSLAHALGIEKYVAFLGDRSDVPELLGRARMFILSSKTEGLSLSLLEAMARGLPVVATRVGGTPEVVVDGTSGLLVPPGDVAALAAAILRIWRDAGFAMALARSARARIERDFDIDRAVAEYEALYLDGLSAGHRAT